MVEDNTDEVKKETAEPEQSPGAGPLEAAPETEETRETPEADREAEALKQLKEAVEQSELPAGQHQQVQDDAQQLAQEDDDRKVQWLLKIADVKGVIYAVKVAQKMNEPYVLDRLHDELIAQEKYHQFLRK